MTRFKRSGAFLDRAARAREVSSGKEFFPPRQDERAWGLPETEPIPSSLLIVLAEAILGGGV